jgi:plastocyanin
MRPATSFLPRRRMGVVLAVMLGAVGCATAAPPNRVIAVVPGFPLEPGPLRVTAGDRLTWVNGDESRGAFRVEFAPGPGAPDVSSAAGTYTARFATPGTYAYTVTATTRTGHPLVPRSGQVVVADRTGAVPPPAPPPPTPAERPVAPEDVAPVGSGISRLKGAPEAYAAYRYRPEQGIVLKVGPGAVEPSMLRPGAEVNLRVTYTVLAPRDAKPIRVKELRTVRYGNQDLRRLEKDVAVSSGTYASEHRLSIPADAAEGTYSVTTVVEIPAVALARGEVSSVFSVLAP